MKFVTVVGARPQFIKAAVVSHVLRNNQHNHQEVLVHTGQHFDDNMSALFFKELNIPEPDYNLGISGGTHAQMTGRMMMAIEDVLIKEAPDWLLIYGDTNSTLAAALAAAKLHIPICHVEAGGRTHSMTNPEEINRICVDHISSLLLASCPSHIEEMKREGLKGILVGNTMYDAFCEYSTRLSLSELNLQSILDGEPVTVPEQGYYYMTCHREENTHTSSSLREILVAMNSLDAPTIYPVHPRNRAQALELLSDFPNIIFINPVGYLESTCLIRHAKKVVTDSGGLQTEAFFAQKKCVTIFDYVCWPETMVDNRNHIAKADRDDILEKLAIEQTIDPSYQPFGDGHAAEKIVTAIETASKGDIHMCAVAMFAFWHGYERLLNSLADYYKGINAAPVERQRQIFLHFAGDGKEAENYRSLAEKLGISDHVYFYGRLDNIALRDLYNRVDIGLCSFGGYKKNVNSSSELKSREYLAAGLPIVTGIHLDLLDYPEFRDYILEFPNDPSPVDMNKIIDFYDRLNLKSPEEARKIAEYLHNTGEKYLNMDAAMESVVDWIKAEKEEEAEEKAEKGDESGTDKHTGVEDKSCH